MLENVDEGMFGMAEMCVIFTIYRFEKSSMLSMAWDVQSEMVLHRLVAAACTCSPASSAMVAIFEACGQIYMSSLTGVLLPSCGFQRIYIILGPADFDIRRRCDQSQLRIYTGSEIWGRQSMDRKQGSATNFI
jgi:hypothetical protein